MADVIGFLRKAFPFIAAGASLGGPIGNLAAAAVGQALGVKVENSPDAVSSAVSDAIAKDPQAALALQQAELNFKQQMAQMQITAVADLEALAVQDRTSARTMQTQVRSKTPAMLAWASVLTMLGCIYFLGFRTTPAAGHDALLILLGAVTVTYKDVYGYFFGSSAGSDAKNEVIADAMHKANA